MSLHPGSGPGDLVLLVGPGNPPPGDAGEADSGDALAHPSNSFLPIRGRPAAAIKRGDPQCDALRRRWRSSSKRRAGGCEALPQVLLREAVNPKPPVTEREWPPLVDALLNYSIFRLRHGSRGLEPSRCRASRIPIPASSFLGLGLLDCGQSRPTGTCYVHMANLPPPSSPGLVFYHRTFRYGTPGPRRSPDRPAHEGPGTPTLLIASFIVWGVPGRPALTPPRWTVPPVAKVPGLLIHIPHPSQSPIPLC